MKKYMSEFANRIEAQRAILSTVGRHGWPTEQLFGLTGKSIDRWVSQNGLDQNADLPQLLKQASKKLFFLANKSQEQITEDYKILSSEVSRIHTKIECEIVALNN